MQRLLSSAGAPALLAAAAIDLASAPGRGLAQGCPVDGQNQASNSASGTACVISPGSTVARVTASNATAITANGVTVNVPYNTAVTATTGAAITFDVDPAAGGSRISGAGGTTGLDAVGPGSQITATGLSINLNGGGTTSAKAEAGGVIALNPGTTIQLSSGGVQGLWATGAGSQITGAGVAITGATGGGDLPVHSQSGATIALSDSTITLGGLSGGKIGMFAETGSALTASNVTLTLAGSGADAAVSVASGATATLTGGSVTLDGVGGGETAMLVQSAGSTLTATDVPIVVTGSGGDAGVKAAGGATVTLSGGSVSASSGAIGELGLWATGAGSTITATDGVQVLVPQSTDGVGVLAATGGAVTLSGGEVTTGGSGSPAYSASAGTIAATDVTASTSGAAAPGGMLQNGGVLTINGGGVTTSGAGSYGFLVQGAAAPANTLQISGAAVNAAADAFHVQAATAVITVTDSTVADANDVLLSTQDAGAAALTASASQLSGAALTETGSTANMTLQNGSAWTMTGSSNLTSLTNNGGAIEFTAPSGDPQQLSSYKTLSAINYAGTGGRIVLNTYLGTDGSPSDQVVVDSGAASGRTLLEIRNTGGPGARTTGDGILVVSAINGGVTAPGAFALANDVRAGAFDYGLFRGGMGGAQDWFLRSDFVIAPPGGGGGGGGGVGQTPGEPEPPAGGGSPGTTSPEEPGTPSLPGVEGGGEEEEVLPPDPPPTPLPPGTYPIIGPEIATYGVVQPMARQMGTATLGTLHERIGQTLAADSGSADASGWGQSTWGRIFGQQVDNRYKAFVDPSAKGVLSGVQAGVDLWRNGNLSGPHDAAGLYFAYANSALTVDGLVTNAAFTGYAQARTGKVDLDAYSGAAYWTHYGAHGWHLDSVLQGTFYAGKATTQNAELPTNGWGLLGSVEGGYPIPLPLGPRFVLEPQGQVILQTTRFNPANDGLGLVALGSTWGETGRIGLRGQWTIDNDNGLVWQPYGRINLWRDWGGTATTVFSGADRVPLLEESTQLEFAGGLTARLNALMSLYLQAGDVFAVRGTDGGRRQAVKGDVGLRFIFG